MIRIWQKLRVGNPSNQKTADPVLTNQTKDCAHADWPSICPANTNVFSNSDPAIEMLYVCDPPDPFVVTVAVPDTPADANCVSIAVLTVAADVVPGVTVPMS